MVDGGWTRVTNTKKARRQIHQKSLDEERLKWDDLLERCPHIILPARAHRIRRKLNIKRLDDCLLSKEWISHQLEGWIYMRVIKPDDKDGIPAETPECVYSVLSIDNGWKDAALFCMYI